MDPEDPKSHESYGSGSGTLLTTNARVSSATVCDFYTYPMVVNCHTLRHNKIVSQGRQFIVLNRVQCFVLQKSASKICVCGPKSIRIPQTPPPTVWYLSELLLSGHLLPVALLLLAPNPLTSLLLHKNVPTRYDLILQLLRQLRLTRRQREIRLRRLLAALAVPAARCPPPGVFRGQAADAVLAGRRTTLVAGQTTIVLAARGGGGRRGRRSSFVIVHLTRQG